MVHLAQKLEHRDGEAHEDHENRDAVGLLNPLATEGLAGEDRDGHDVHQQDQADERARLEERDRNDHGGERPEGPDPDDVPGHRNHSDPEGDLEEQAREEQDREETIEVRADVLADNEEGG